jgi:CrcB protein
VTVAGAARSAAPRQRTRRLPAGALVAVAVGGFAGGLARYEIGLALPSPPRGFPWAVFAVNTSGAFLLALLVVLLDEALPPTAYARPALGTGFLGAFTTFSSVAGAVDQLGAHGRPGLAAGYLLASTAAGLAAAVAGLLTGRALAGLRSPGRRERG